ncbi:M48 family metalloprotease [Haloterrigena salifodinae]
MSEGPPRLSLGLRMIATTLVLAALTLGFLAVIWRIVAAIVSLFALPSIIAGAVALGLLVIFVGVQLGQISTVTAHADARPVPLDAYPALDGAVTRAAAQLDVPAPTIAVSDRSAPEALVVGFRPERVHLILSRGAIDALEDDELEAVVAHELAHVANRDAMVMTAAATPIVLARALKSKAARLAFARPDETESPTAFLRRSPGKFVGYTLMRIAAAPQRLLWVLFGGLSVVTLALATPAVAVLSRGRELAADRTAAAATGSPAALASALRTLEDGIAETPAEDLREASSISSLSILPLDRPGDDATAAGTAGSKANGDLGGRLERLLFATHPSTERRLEILADLEATEAAA